MARRKPTRLRKAQPSAKGGAAGRKPPPVTLAAAPVWDMGAMGPANRYGLVEEERGELDPRTGKVTNPNGVKGVRRVDMLEVWHKQGRISTAGYNAAVALFKAFEATAKAPGWPDNDRVQSSPKPDHAVTIQIDRLSAFHAIARLVHADDRAIIGECVLDKGTPARIRG